MYGLNFICRMYAPLHNKCQVASTQTY
jgi:hypothetical protein